MAHRVRAGRSARDVHSRSHLHGHEGKIDTPRSVVDSGKAWSMAKLPSSAARRWKKGECFVAQERGRIEGSRLSAGRLRRRGAGRPMLRLPVAQEGTAPLSGFAVFRTGIAPTRWNPCDSCPARGPSRRCRGKDPAVASRESRGVLRSSSAGRS